MDESAKISAAKRLAIIRGHLNKVIDMVSDDAYCPDVIHQSQAIQAALKNVDEIILHGHLHHCVLKDIHEKGSKKEKLINEILDVFSKQT
ncbi:hypothetical protein A3A76_01420 [Candidatus Woesebacteria bacterium RIFCSPLOWO2_01_FULL_39_23]|uniref:Transcriptional regulator n=1 Tax=Candidatus Woesebacteria bacterium RIFCSPHIGHO2_01_FULL_40_22 TaxID=1802499 RepID=A0A1F7YGL6_9BACT|nr:MAG: hypothetical protein A2141_04950 [Candidatus Woesebacteria bacterium RBG_16_40_11]OGM26484.1 MAG: hypothetical protein A2628_03015 [Candidatus Woesebacteria bacterium RIFCSPHIGHO2_01_FULL_40_22]OGM37653.1 MAG: hypothetical protein A3E41_05535 [Candidatus Woesebacteria bacterium RIFCSPHIGHO2_12_FULL_38_9]OGM62937.1 MAG: hypothetical protein A3A76_01420 [Candidatus Woesebacteria bacterium RIFCSPLOWO2_01_FULL_39_23]